MRTVNHWLGVTGTGPLHSSRAIENEYNILKILVSQVMKAMCKVERYLQDSELLRGGER